MLRLLLVSFIFFQAAWLRSPPSSPELAHRSTPLSSIDPSCKDFSDLEPLIGLIGDAHIVQLGELSHGDGGAFLARTRLVKFLHERMGFDLLVFESGFFECRDVAALLGSSMPLGDTLRRGVYPVWRLSAQMQPLFEYIRETASTARPLTLAGFDPQFSAADSAQRIVEVITPILAECRGKSRSEELRKRLDEVAEACSGAGAVKIDDSRHRLNEEMFMELRRALTVPTLRFRATTSPHHREWLGRVVENLAAMERSIHVRGKAPPFDPGRISEYTRHPQVIHAGNIRNRAMAENLAWLLEHTARGRKTIVWAANNHVAYKHKTTALSPLPGNNDKPAIEPAGLHHRRALGARVFTLLSIVHEGSWAAPTIRREDKYIWQSGEYPSSEPTSLAHALHELGLKHAVVDVRGLEQLFTERQSLFGDDPVRMDEFADAVLFFDTMIPSTPIRSTE